MGPKINVVVESANHLIIHAGRDSEGLPTAEDYSQRGKSLRGNVIIVSFPRDVRV